MTTPRTHTPDRKTVNAEGHTITTITQQRACNGCSTLIGDITDQEMAAAINGRPLPDVRRECPDCGLTAPEPACRPTKAVCGDEPCLEVECDHNLTDGAEYCDEVREEAICVTHSEFDRHGQFTHAEPWPCKHSSQPATA